MVYVGLIVVMWEVYTLLKWGHLDYKRRWFNVLIGIDQLGNAYLGGDPDETISSRAAKNSHVWGWHVLGVILNKIDPGHLQRSLERDEGKDQIF